MMRARTIVKSAVLMLLLAGAYASASIRFDVQPIREIGKPRERSMPIVASAAQPTTLSDSDIVETQTRPLFSASRRPFVAKVVVADNAATETAVEAPPAVAPRRIRLLGVNIFGGGFTALVQNQDSQEIRWIDKGQAFDGWVLMAADKDSAHFACPQKQGADCSYDVALYAVRQGE